MKLPKFMKFNIISIFILILLLKSFMISAQSIKSTEIKTFFINLDLPPEERFVEVSTVYKEKLIEVFNQYISFIPKIARFLFKAVSRIFWLIKPEHVQEIKGISSVTGLDPKEILLLQYAYEFSAFCTSVVLSDKNGTIIHSRNLDFLFAEKMRGITYQGVFLKGNRQIFKAVMFAGLTGVMTGKSLVGSYSISLNERKPSWRKDPLDLIWNIANVFMKFPQVSQVIRDTLTECTSYSCALNNLSTTHQIAPSYYAISGNEPYEGAIVTRDRYGVAHLDILTEDVWYLVQTNDDHWENICSIRCSYVKENLDSIGRDDINGEKLVNILTQWPSNNSHSIYNTLMINKNDIFMAQLIENDQPAPI